MEIIIRDETSGCEPQREHRFTQRSITLGRLPTCDLMIISPTVSRVHLELRLEHGGCWLIPRTTGNGTFINGLQVQAGKSHKLELGDKIGLGKAGPVFTLISFKLQVAVTGELPRLDALAATQYDADTQEPVPASAIATGSFCRTCGAIVTAGKAFCPACGTNLQTDDRIRANLAESAPPQRPAPATMPMNLAPPVLASPAESATPSLASTSRQTFSETAPPTMPPVLAAAPPPPAQAARPPVIAQDTVDWASAPTLSAPPQPTAPMSPMPPASAAKSSPFSFLGRLWHGVFSGNGAPSQDAKPTPVKGLSPTSAPTIAAKSETKPETKSEQPARPVAPATVAAINDAVRVARQTTAETVQTPVDVVDCTIYAPPATVRGTSLLVQVFAHLSRDADVVRALAQRFDAQAKERGFQSLEVEIERGEKLDFHLAMPGLEVEYPVYSLVWRGRPNSVQFGVRVPHECDLGTYLGTIRVSLRGLPVGHIKFKLDVLAEAQKLPAPEITGRGRAYRRAFVSFAEADRAEAMKRAQMLTALRIETQPVNWENERKTKAISQSLIDESDLFLLCWSEAARRSERVRQELDYALEHQDKNADDWPEILPVPLEQPIPQPPTPLQYLSFDDFLPYWERVATAPTQVSQISQPQGFATLPGASRDVRGQLVKGRYQVGELLGEGGFGSAYRAADLTLAQRPVVVKVLHAESLRNAWLVRKFQHEIEALARLQHNGIVGIFDAGQLPDERPFLVLEYISGQPLRDVLRSDGLPLDEVRDIITQSSAALSAAHEKGIIHRDIKPENIMLQPLADGGQQVKLIDFGIAKVCDAVLAPTTEGVRVAGTYLYMSPEQFVGRILGPASDIFSLGVVAYEMATGRLPFQVTAIGQLPAVHQKEVTPPHELRSEIPVAASAALLKALAYKPAERYANAAGFGQSLAYALR